MHALVQGEAKLLLRAAEVARHCATGQRVRSMLTAPIFCIPSAGVPIVKATRSLFAARDAATAREGAGQLEMECSSDSAAGPAAASTPHDCALPGEDDTASTDLGKLARPCSLDELNATAVCSVIMICARFHRTRVCHTMGALSLPQQLTNVVFKKLGRFVGQPG